MNGVVPFADEVAALDVDGLKLLVENLHAGGIDVFIGPGVDLQAGFGSGVGDEVHEHFMVSRRAASPSFGHGKRSVSRRLVHSANPVASQ